MDSLGTSNYGQIRQEFRRSTLDCSEETGTAAHGYKPYSFDGIDLELDLEPGIDLEVGEEG